MNTISRGCKRCHGDLFLEREGLSGKFFMHCLQCGADYHLKPLPVMSKAHEKSLNQERMGFYAHKMLHKPHTFKRKGPPAPQPRLIGSIEHCQDERIS